MTAEHVLERLTEGAAVITPGDRSDVVLAVLSAHAAEGFPSLSCVILNGGLPLHPSVKSLVAGLGLRLPILETRFGSFETASRVAATRGRVTMQSHRKVDTALALMEIHVDTADLLAQLSIAIPTAVTPKMFTHRLLDRARSDRKRIVLPEGNDDRILKAAGRLLQRSVSDLTILGEEVQVRARAAELGVNLSRAAVIDPQTSELCHQFAQQYAELRSHKGSRSSMLARSFTTSHTSAPCWCTTTWSTEWCRGQDTRRRTQSDRRSRSSGREKASLQSRAYS